MKVHCTIELVKWDLLGICWRQCPEVRVRHNGALGDAWSDELFEAGSSNGVMH